MPCLNLAYFLELCLCPSPLPRLYFITFTYHFYYLAYALPLLPATFTVSLAPTPLIYHPLRSYKFLFFCLLSWETNLDIKRSTTENYPTVIRFSCLLYFAGSETPALDEAKSKAIRLNSHLQLHQQV